MILLNLSNQLIQVIIFQVLSLVIRRRRSSNNYIKSVVSCCTLYGKERIMQVEASYELESTVEDVSS